ncbi:hypothetical protein H0H87_008364 [Tephrocybe sp. NHM501043]|nr:hypothetical protein H0H87_008364 [Tephrocybe sp. NHM501043]
MGRVCEGAPEDAPHHPAPSHAPQALVDLDCNCLVGRPRPAWISWFPALGPQTTPSPANNDFPIDLSHLGYASVFVHLPKSPKSPVSMKPVETAHPRPKSIKRFRSLTLLRSRTRPTNATAPSSPNPHSPPIALYHDHEMPQILAASIAQRKKTVYAHAKPSKTAAQPKAQKPKPKADLPPSLAAELALMQFADGGSAEDNIKRLMQAHARAAAPAGAKLSAEAPAPLGDVYRDGKGGVWWDREEEMEYMHLLGGHDASRVVGPEKWVSFGGEVVDGDAALAIASLNTDADPGMGRRGSANSIASNVSSLDPCNVVKPAEEDAAVVRVPLLPVPTNTPREPILTIPSRPRHGHHLRPSPNFFLLDLNAFVVPSTPSTPRTPKTPKTPHTPRTPHTPSAPYPSTHRTRTRSRPSPITPAFAQAQPQTRPRGPARRRPAPLNIVANAPMRGVSPDLDDEAQARREFVEASFTPPAPAAVIAPRKRGIEAVCRVPDTLRALPLEKKGSRMLLGLFGRK